MKKTLAMIVVCALAALSVAAQTSLSGTWQIEYHDKNGKEVDYPVVSFVQTGPKLEGVFGDKHWRVEGSVNGSDVQFAFHPPQRPDITVRYAGKLESENRLRGTMASEVQSGTFTATRRN